MLTRDDIIDAIIAGLAKAKPAMAAPSSPSRAAVVARPSAVNPRPSARPHPGPKGRSFWTEYDIKKALTAGGKRLTLPSDAIVSPLASDWLALRGIEIVRA